MIVLVVLGLAAAGIALVCVGFRNLRAWRARDRHQRRTVPVRRSARQPRVWASVGRGRPFVWISLPLIGGWRIGRRL